MNTAPAPRIPPVHPRLIRMPVARIMLVLACLVPAPATAAQVELAPGQGLPASEDEPIRLDQAFLAGVRFRSLGPGMTSGRIADIAVDRRNPKRYVVASASGGVWLTENAGTTFTPLFDGEGSYSIGCVTIDPSDPFTIWVGTGENRSQRSVSFGDGVYRSRDGGRTWENMGLRESEHIGMVVVHPRTPDTIYVAAQGPLWRDGGDRGLYRSIDGGASWARILHVSEQTGISEVHLDPRDPRVMYAVAYQRRRHVWTLVNGGPESGIYKSTDGGGTWRRLQRGLPSADMGKIGMAIAPADPDTLYAIVEAAMDEGGVFRSSDRGETWSRRNPYMTTSPQYYNEIVACPHDARRVYFLDTVLHVTEDGGDTVRRMPIRDKHVDDHALWISPQDPAHLRVGSDGGLYETFDRGEHWKFFPNLPVSQFYRVSVDDRAPFYFVYGGTQDNNTVGGPSRTTSPAGIANEDWFVTVGGDGFVPRAEPGNPDIVYSQWQYGGLVRHDRRTGQNVDIKPREAPGDEPLRWNWDSPFIISPHDPARLYFGAQRLFRSDDRGSTWKAISGDLSRGLNRHTLPVFGVIQSVDAVARHNSTSVFGNLVALSESPLVEDLIVTGADDGAISITEDGGVHWRRITEFPSVPDVTCVSSVVASRHDARVIYASFDNRKMGDFTPYLLRSDDTGHTWRSMRGDLPDRQVVYTVLEDPKRPGMLFAGTEFGVFVTFDGGLAWHRLSGGLPTVAVRDLAIQEREDDLVLGTFGRGIYVLDQIEPLRALAADGLADAARLYPVRPALRYIETSRLGGRTGRGAQGAQYFTAANPPFGAVFTFHIKESLRTKQETRREEERRRRRAGEQVRIPTDDDLRAEHDAPEARVLLVVEDDAGETVARLDAPRRRGLHRLAWNLRYPSEDPLSPGDARGGAPAGPLALPGDYSVTLVAIDGGEVRTLAGPETFQVTPLELGTLPAADAAEQLAFQRRVGAANRRVRGALRIVDETATRIALMRETAIRTPGVDLGLVQDIDAAADALRTIDRALRGDRTPLLSNEPQVPSISERIRTILSNQHRTTQPPTGTERESLAFAESLLTPVLQALDDLMDVRLAAIEERLDAAHAPWTPGRRPRE